MTTAVHMTLLIGSAILSIHFVSGVYKEYTAGASIMEASETPVAALDNPTITLCFESWVELNFGEHLVLLTYSIHSARDSFGFGLRSFCLAGSVLL